MSEASSVRTQLDGPILRVTINRPKALNALNRATLTQLEEVLDGVGADVRVVILTGAGEKAFVAGADIAEMANITPLEAAAFSALGHAVGDRIAAMDAVVIAQVNGFALGGGCELMMACDFAIASDNARLGQPEVGLGVTAGFGGTTRLVRRVGLARAQQLLLTGDHIKADQALAWGLVNEVVPAGELAERVTAIANKIVKNAPLAVAASKRAANLAAETDLATANRYEQQIFGMCFSTADQKAGMAAFLARETPEWSGA